MNRCGQCDRHTRLCTQENAIASDLWEQWYECSLGHRNKRIASDQRTASLAPRDRVAA